MSAPRRRFVYLCLALPFAISLGPLVTHVHAQSKPTKPANGATTSPKASPSQQNAKPTTPSLQSKIAADVSASRDLGDYVPCEFSRADLLNLRPQPPVFTLTGADEDALRTLIIGEALDNKNAIAFPTGKRDVFVQHISESAFVGLTPSQATGRILYVLAQDTAPAPEVSDLLNAASKGNATFAEYLSQNYQIDSKAALAKLGQQEQAPEAKLSAAMNLAQNKLATAKPDETGLLAAATSKNRDYAQYVTKTFNLDVEQALGATEKSPESKLDVTSQVATTSGKSDAQQVANDARELASAASLNTTASEGASALQQVPAKNQVAQAAQQATGALARPLDVACSMSILSYETTRYAFGQRMADEFIPVQIIVRNLNSNKEFLVQDAQLGVDEDINGRLGRYAAGVDKLTARTFMLSSRDYSHRNLVVHLAQGLGTVLSSSSLVYGEAVKDAANVYSAGFLNALTGVWTDHGTEHLNLLNDEGFSSYRTERTVVPKSGTAEFVIFFRSDQFQEGWWVQDCAENIIIQNPNQVSQISARQSAKCVGQMNLQSPDPRCLANTEISVDLEAARRVCLHFYKAPANRSVDVCSDSDSTCEPNLVDIGTSKDVEGDFAYFKPRSVIYKKWSPRATALFRELSLAVIAGTHIEEETSTKPSLMKIDCPADDKGDVDFDKAENSMITCTLTGNNLDQVQTLKLRNATDATDTKTGSGTVTTTTSGTSKTTKVAFPLETLGGLPAKSYKVYTVTKDGVEGGGDQQIHFANGQPYLPADSKPDPNTLNLADLLGKNGKPIPITLKGYHLDSLEAVRFAKSSNDKTNADVTPFDVSVEPGATSTQASITVKPDDVKKAKLTGDFTTQKIEFSVALVSKDAPNSPIVTKQVIYGTGNLTPTPVSAPAKKPTVAPNGGNAKH
jgi:hypothetical protein